MLPKSGDDFGAIIYPDLALLRAHPAPGVTIAFDFSRKFLEAYGADSARKMIGTTNMTVIDIFVGVARRRRKDQRPSAVAFGTDGSRRGPHRAHRRQERRFWPFHLIAWPSLLTIETSASWMRRRRRSLPRDSRVEESSKACAATCGYNGWHASSLIRAPDFSC